MPRASASSFARTPSSSAPTGRLRAGSERRSLTTPHPPAASRAADDSLLRLGFERQVGEGGRVLHRQHLRDRIVQARVARVESLLPRMPHVAPRRREHVQVGAAVRVPNHVVALAKPGDLAGVRRLGRKHKPCVRLHCDRNQASIPRLEEVETNRTRQRHRAPHEEHRILFDQLSLPPPVLRLPAARVLCSGERPLPPFQMAAPADGARGLPDVRQARAIVEATAHSTGRQKREQPLLRVAALRKCEHHLAEDVIVLHGIGRLLRRLLRLLHT
mmetsp:Transcript_36575/g.114914  ORF Transcript_36575/g.114914 Transcript_36575/m.114914 type:complete len:273 (-) Transcript_36575:16-834(-)